MEGKGKSGIISEWQMIKIVSNSCNPNKKEQKKTITDTDVSWYEAWHQVCTTCNNDVTKIGERL